MKNDKKPCANAKCGHPYFKHYGTGCGHAGCECTAYKGSG